MNRENHNIHRHEKQLSEDARNLLQHAPDLRNYHEIHHRDQIQEILQRWPLLNLTSERTVVSPPATSSSGQGANVVLVAGAAGGVGATTVVANLASALHQQGGRVLAVDLSPGQDLHLHLGEHRGQTGTGDSRLMVEVLSAQDGHSSLQNEDQQSNWLAAHLPTHLPDSYDWILIDCPWFAQATFHQACSITHQVLLVCTTEPAAFYRTSRALADPVSAPGPGADRLHMLINRFNPAHLLQQDIHTLLHSSSPVDLAPAEIPYDSRIADSLALGRSFLSLDPDCEVARCFHSLGYWLASQATQRRAAAP